MVKRPEIPNQMSVNLMTEVTYERLQNRLEELKNSLREAQLRVGETAGQSHDWHDNAPFDQARADVEKFTSMVTELQNALKTPEIIKPNPNTEKVQIGNSVVLKFSDEPETSTFTVLGPYDANSKKGWVSHKTPLAQAILGKKTGEEVDFETPSGKLNLKIIEILPGQFE